MNQLIGIDDWTVEQKQEFLANWKIRRPELHNFSEKLLDDLIIREVKGECRKSCLTAIHARFSLVRKERERKGLEALAEKKKAKDRAARTVS